MVDDNDMAITFDVDEVVVAVKDEELEAVDLTILLIAS